MQIENLRPSAQTQLIVSPRQIVRSKLTLLPAYQDTETVLGEPLQPATAVVVVVVVVGNVEVATIASGE